MRYFVTGATGFIGGHLARQLLAAGHEVVMIARDPAKASELAAMGADVERGDVTARETMRAPMTGVDGVFHVAGWYEVGRRHREMCQRVNVDGTRNVLELMRELRIPKGVYTSTVGVFGDTRGKTVDESYRSDGRLPTAYERTKWAAHYVIAEPMMREGLPLVIVQPGVTYGPGDTSPVGDAIRQYLRRKLRGIPRTATYCWAHVDDTARAHILAMEKGRPGEPYVIAGEPRTFASVFDFAGQVTGIPPPRLRLSAGTLRFLAAITGSEMLRAAPASYVASHAKATRELGITHRPFEPAMRETLLEEMARLGIHGASAK